MLILKRTHLQLCAHESTVVMHGCLKVMENSSAHLFFYAHILTPFLAQVHRWNAGPKNL